MSLGAWVRGDDGKLSRATTTVVPPKCEPWCGDMAPDGAEFWNAGGVEAMDHCSEACMDAGRSLHPTGPLPGHVVGAFPDMPPPCVACGEAACECPPPAAAGNEAVERLGIDVPAWAAELRAKVAEAQDPRIAVTTRAGSVATFATADEAARFCNDLYRWESERGTPEERTARRLAGTAPTFPTFEQLVAKVGELPTTALASAEGPPAWLPIGHHPGGECLPLCGQVRTGVHTLCVHARVPLGTACFCTEYCRGRALAATPRGAVTDSTTGNGRTGEIPARTLTDETGTGDGPGPAAPIPDCASGVVDKATGARGQKAVPQTVVGIDQPSPPVNSGSPLESGGGDGGLDSAWPARDVVAKLVAAAVILLDDHDYDGHGWEEINAARDVARRHLRATAKKPTAPVSIVPAGDGYDIETFVPDGRPHRDAPNGSCYCDGCCVKAGLTPVPRPEAPAGFKVVGRSGPDVPQRSDQLTRWRLNPVQPFRGRRVGAADESAWDSGEYDILEPLPDEQPAADLEAPENLTNDAVAMANSAYVLAEKLSALEAKLATAERERNEARAAALKEARLATGKAAEATANERRRCADATRVAESLKHARTLIEDGADVDQEGASSA